MENQKNIIVDIVTDIVCDGEKISSTKIRKINRRRKYVKVKRIIGI